ncbi:metallophosphoesterase N-terminal domain-containing protein [Phocaeicola sp. HCN-6420]|uniref:metallophosphoesterase N-terminal domain-containing protein n=1 Tax=Phocaeicola sp. HCN-6420 TaxID=3134673 RepID=UPI0030C559A9
MRKFAAYLVWFVLGAALPLTACSKDEAAAAVADSFNVKFECPSLIEVSKGGEYTFQVEDGEAPQVSDVLVLESTDGVLYTCTLVSVSDNSFTVELSEECESGTYRVFIKRGDRKKQIGTTYINVLEGTDVKPDAGTTVYGVVSTADGPVPGVVVSDGVEVTVTDEQGIYQLQSDKEWGYVFISVPAGYEVPADGVLPQFYKMMKGDAATAERVDFSLTAVDGQDDYKVLVLGDMHLANRTGDLGQFMDFTSDLNAYRALHQQEKMYAIALGDMTWDLYWYSNSYALPEYLNTINSQVKGLQIFHTIGNHDYDYKATNDRDAESRFMDYIAPTYYSFNLGKVHYVVLDDIDCSNYDGTTSRDYEKRVSAEQLSWLAKDLSHVDKSVPLVVVMHAQLFYPSQTDGFKVDHDVLNTTQLLNVLDGYKVHFITGHTHMNYNGTTGRSDSGIQVCWILYS